MKSFLEQPITSISGVGEARAKQLAKLGVSTVEDLLLLVPRRLEDRTNLKQIAEVENQEYACVRGVLQRPVQVRMIRKGMTIYTAAVQDGSGLMQAVWFNNRFIKESLKVGEPYIFYGKMEYSFQKRQMQTPIFEKEGQQSQTGRLVPIYPLTANLSQKVLSNVVEKCLQGLEPVEDPLPTWMRQRYQLPDLHFAFQNIHAPQSVELFAIARRRFVFEEFLLLQMGLRSLNTRRETLETIPFQDVDYTPFLHTLSFSMTGAQERVLGEIAKDVASKKPMNRLVQGDVGSGKTAVAACGLYLAVKNGFQGVLMAPTEILARQHYEGLTKLFSTLGVHIALLTGSLSAKQKREILEGIQTGFYQIVIGTHAVLEETVQFSNLAFVVTDEQHRFGVRQRGALASKGKNPHVLVMTATPIPRTLALILYGDLDLSVIDELPPGRQKVDTFVVGEDMRQRIYRFIRKEVESGRQAYIVCPLVEESDAMELTSAMAHAETLQTKVFPDLATGLLHGKMKHQEKDAVMADFAAGKIKILVSTTVIEVGVNVPNATVMVVENAERFGLSQLHQLRGRVGRGADKSYCILFCDRPAGVTKQRMDIMHSTNDGFVIAQKDLELRGPGEFFGTRQHGLPELKIGDMFTDADILAQAGKACEDLLAKDRALCLPEHAYLRKKLLQMFYGYGAENMFN